MVGNACNNITVFSVVRAAAVSGQQLGKHVPAATDFLCSPCRDVISKGQSQSSSTREAVKIEHERVKLHC
jgi:hypothetical protein